jgi:hypothetical protein
MTAWAAFCYAGVPAGLVWASMNLSASVWRTRTDLPILTLGIFLDRISL